jgi:hypothetical protein
LGDWLAMGADCKLASIKRLYVFTDHPCDSGQ